MRIALQPIGDVPREVLEDLVEDLKGLGDASILDPIPLDPAWREPKGDQVRADPILDEIEPEGAHRVLGVTAADLHTGAYDFIFGLAKVQARPAVISLFRLGSTDPRVSRERVAKEAIHELGHTLGADNCPNRECVMSFSASVDAVDRKTAAFCGRCRPTIEFSAKRLRT